MTLFFSPYSLWPCNLRCLALSLPLPYHECKSSIEGVGVSIHFGFTVSGAVLVVYWCDNNLVQGCGIQLLVQYGKGCISGL